MSLVEKLKNKDQAAYEQLINQYSNIFLYMAKKYFKNDEDCRDCLQEIFLKIYTNIDKCEVSDKNLKPWLIKLASNCIIDYFRSQERRKAHFLLDNTIVDTISQTSSNCYNSILLDELKIFLGEEDYNILIYHKIMNLTYKEIASILNIPPHTTRRRVISIYNRAVQFLGLKENKYETK